MHRIITTLLVLSLAAPVAAGEEGRALQYGLGTLLNGVALNAVAATRTANIDLQNERTGYDVLALHIAHTNASGALTITMDCFNDPDAGDAVTAQLQDCTVSTGTCTSSDADWSKAVTTSKTWVWRVDVAGLPGQVNCVFAASGAGATDTILVKGWLVTK
jgi:hypothetical protein